MSRSSNTASKAFLSASKSSCFRTGHHSDLLELELTRRNIPFVKFGGLKFLESAHIKDVLAILRLLENPRDEVSWFRVLQLLDGIGPAGARSIIQSIGLRNPPTNAQETPLFPCEFLRGNAPAGDSWPVDSLPPRLVAQPDTPRQGSPPA